MASYGELDVRMKTDYEQIPKTKLMRRTPVIIRLDGKAFHTFTKKFQKPFDEVLIKSMQEATKYLCENIQGCVLGYTQSDEISLVLIDYQKLNSGAWFDYEVQKMCSVSSSMVTLAFNRAFEKEVQYFKESTSFDKDMENQYEHYLTALETGAVFDSRVFNIPKEEVTNYFYWRQLDASRNSVQMVGHANFPHKDLQNKSCSTIQDMLMNEKGINWNDFPTYKKRGSCIIKEKYYIEDQPTVDTKPRTRWIVDKDIPIFREIGRDYINKLIMIDES